MTVHRSLRRAVLGRRHAGSAGATAGQRGVTPTDPNGDGSRGVPPIVVDLAQLVLDLPDDLTSASALGRATAGPAAPSFHREVMQVRAQYRTLPSVEGGTQTPLRQLSRKLLNYRYALSHGVAPPRVLGVWRGLDDVPWADLPETFVLKAERGAGSRSVMPLRRSGDGYESVDGRTRYPPAELERAWRALRSRHVCSGPYFAEELLEDRDGGVVPPDAKIFAFYGEVAHIMLRRVTRTGHGARPTRRYLYPDGSGVPDEYLTAEQDHRMPTPGSLPALVAAAEVLSRNAPFPFLRVDMYDVGGRPVFGELTGAPGGRRAYTLPYDRRLGQLWSQAQARLSADLYSGRRYRMLPGDHPTAAIPGPARR